MILNSSYQGRRSTSPKSLIQMVHEVAGGIIIKCFSLCWSLTCWLLSWCIQERMNAELGADDGLCYLSSNNGF
jgi:hypothetical protein